MKFWGVILILSGIYVAFEWGIRGNHPWSGKGTSSPLPGTATYGSKADIFAGAGTVTPGAGPNNPNLPGRPAIPG